METPGSYQALSYMWGSTTEDKRVMTCNGHEFMATANLFAALIRFRDVSTAKRLWIDALCINQSSLSERAQQVNLMRKIYHQAERVLIWVGEDDKDGMDLELLFRIADARNDYALGKRILENVEQDSVVLLHNHNLEAMEIVANVQRRFGISVPAELALLEFVIPDDDFGSWRSIYVRHSRQSEIIPGSLKIMVVLPDFDLVQVKRAAESDHRDFEEFLMEAIRPAELNLSPKDMGQAYSSLQNFLSMPYFQRAWVVQEMLVSSKATMICGKHEIDFEAFWSVYGMDKRTGMDIKNFYSEDLHLWEAAQNVEIIRSIGNFMSAYESAESTVISQISYHRRRAETEKLKNLRLADLLEHYGSQKATDPHDHIFSLVGLVQQYSEISEEVQWCRDIVDYVVDYRVIFLATAQRIAANFQQRKPENPAPSPHHILSFYKFDSVGNIEERPLPTWVPDWSSTTRKIIVHDTRRIFEIDALIPYHVRFNDSSFFIPGHVVDRVSVVTGLLRKSENMYNEVALCSLLTAGNTPNPYGTLDEQFEAFWRTIIADNPVGSKPPTDFTYHFQEHEAVQNWVSHCRNNYDRICQNWSSRLGLRLFVGNVVDGIRRFPEHKERGIAVLRERLAEVVENIDQVMEALLSQDAEPKWDSLEARSELSPYHFIVTQKGYFGIASPGVRSDDSLAILAGSEKVWFLRNKQDHYLISGVGWVHGLMYENDPYYQHGWKEGDIVEIELR